MEKVALLAGAGRLPVELARAAREMGYEVCAVALLEATDPELDQVAHDCAHISIAKLGKIISYLKKQQVKKALMIGKVTKELLFEKKVIPDFKMVTFLAGLPNRKDDTIMLGFVRELEKIGVTAFDQTILIRKLMPAQGTLTKLEPTAEQRRDMEYGFQVARELGRLDIGQTVVVKDMAVMALEAIEGTDACIRRGGELAREGAVVVKVAKPQQDNRFDVPAVGATTLESMIAVHAKVLAIQAGETLLVERERVLAMAEQHGIAVVAM